MKSGAERTFRLTAAGTLALQAKRSVPGWYRTILAMIQGDTPSGAICEILGAHPRKQVIAWLEQLETLGFVALADRAGAPPAQETSADFGFDVVLARQRAA